MIQYEPVAGHVAKFAHTALIVTADPDLPGVLVPELRRSVAVYDEVLVVVGERTRAVLNAAAADLATAVRWGHSDAIYQRLGVAYESFRRYLTDSHRAGRRVHVIAEPDLIRGMDDGLCADRVTAYLAYEAISNQAPTLDGSAVTCVWDSRDHPTAVIDGIRATHPHLLTATGRRASSWFVRPGRFLTGRHDPQARPVPARVALDMTVLDVTGLRGLRSAMTAWAAVHDFGDEAVEDLVVAVAEVTSNGLRHGGTPVRLRAWRLGDTLVVQCDDSGPNSIPVAAGYHRPRPVAGGRGLWLARLLADVVAVSSSTGGTSVRLHFPRRLMRASRPAL